MDLENIVNVAVTAVNGVMFLSTVGLAYASYKYVHPGKGKNVIAVVPLYNMITPKDKPGKMNSNSVIKSLEKLSKNKKIKGIIFDINSGGGAIYQSKEIAEYIRTKVKVPKVAWAKDVCASGAYMIACATDHIIAREESAIGSIGVISAHIAAGGLLHKLGIEYDVIKAGINKDSHLPFNRLTRKQRSFVQNQTNYIYKIFIEYVAENRARISKRPIDIDAIKKVATGDVFYGDRSLQAGLIDEFGSMDQAINYLELKGNFKHSGIYQVPDSSSPFSKLGLRLGASISNGITEEFKSSILEDIKMVY